MSAQAESTTAFARDELPPGWRMTTIGELLKVRNGFAFKSTEYQEDGALLIRQSNLDGSRVTIEKAKYLPKSYLDEYRDFQIRKGDILIGMSGSIGKLCTYDRDEPALQNQRTGLLVFKDPEQKPWVWHYLPLLEKDLVKVGKGVAVQNVSASQIESFPIPVAPLDQQKLIVAEIEKQFSRLDEAVANLKRVKANLKRYKAAVLKAAVEGRLVETEAELARREGRSYETGAQLLQRILETRRSQWKGKGKYKEPAAPDTTDLPELPKGWVWATVLQVTDVASGNTPTGILGAVKESGDVPWFKVGDMNHQENQQVMRRADAWLSHTEVRKLGLRLFPPNTVLFPKRGGAIATNKKRRLESVGCADLNVMGITPDGAITAYVFTWFDGVDLASLSDGSNVPQINHKDIEPLLIPLPPLAEQHRIVAEVERRLSLVREVESQLDANHKRAERLRQSILKTAFSAELVIPRE